MLDDMTLASAWEEQSDAWIAWTRARESGGFRTMIWPALREVLPQPRDGLTLDVGCGEGRSGQALRSFGYRVVGVERSVTLAKAAALSRLTVVTADASVLPFLSHTFQLAVACMSFQDMDDHTSAIAEVGRVLASDGQLYFAIWHPFSSAQDDPTAQVGCTISEPYLASRPYQISRERNGNPMIFNSVHRPLGHYITALTKAGLYLFDVREIGAGVIPWLLIGCAAKQP